MSLIVRILGLLMLVMGLAACDELLELDVDMGSSVVDSVPAGETARVVNVIDGDTIDVVIDGAEYRVRYVGVNTPERDEVCYQDATNANRDLVQGQTVTLVRDESDTDRFGRLLRYIYVGDVFVNDALVRNGWAEAVLYNPDDRHYNAFRSLEQAAARNGVGCHSTGIFDDGNDTR
jgi:endonuclease YncB( thermonuclease family)